MLAKSPDFGYGPGVWLGAFMTYFDRVTKHEWSQAERDKAAKDGVGMSDGAFPIRSAQDVKDAVELAHMSHHPFSEVKAHVKARAMAIGAERELPEDWKDEKEK